MNWEYIVQCIDLALGILLIIRLFSTRLYRTYKLFCSFLITDLSVSALYILNQLFGLFSSHVYFVCWLILKPVIWLFTLLMVYSLLEKILVQLPGLLRLSRRILHLVFLIALVIGLVSARYEYSAPGFAATAKAKKFIIQCWTTEMVLDRVVASTVLLCLIAITAFLRWFPVRIPRNLAAFSVGFAVYFTAMTVLLLTRSLWPNEALKIVTEVLKVFNLLMGSVSGICFAFWIFLLSPAGEFIPSTMAIQRQPQEQERLIAQLELINDALLKAARR
jgi:hypothetical protein